MRAFALILIAALAVSACGRKGDPVAPEPRKSFAEELAEDRPME